MRGGGSTEKGSGVVVVHTLCSLRFFAVFGLAARGGGSLSLSLSLSISLPPRRQNPSSDISQPQQWRSGKSFDVRRVMTYFTSTVVVTS
jgi:hypothetical protein